MSGTGACSARRSLWGCSAPTRAWRVASYGVSKVLVVPLTRCGCPCRSDEYLGVDGVSFNNYLTFTPPAALEMDTCDSSSNSEVFDHGMCDNLEKTRDQNLQT